jgi:hypothetical protein
MALRETHRLEQSARKAAFGRLKSGSIRAAVRDLTYTALRSRVLTLPHLADVAAAIEHGIRPEPAARSGSSPKLASEGLCDAMLQALIALDVAAREYLAIGGHLSGAELDRWLTAIDALPEVVNRDIDKRLASLKKTLQAAESDAESEGTYVLGLLASGALLGLLEGAPTPSAP